MFVSVESPKENGTYLEGHRVGHFGGVLRGIVRRLIKPFGDSLYVTIVAVISMKLAGFSGNVKAGMGTIVKKGCGGEAVAVRVKRRR